MSVASRPSQGGEMAVSGIGRSVGGRSRGRRDATTGLRCVAAAVMVASMVVAVPATAAAQSQRFPDVPPDHYAYEAVEWAAEVGVTTGYDDGTFKPERPLIKRHAVVFMERYYDEILQAEESEDFTRGDMMVLLKAINDGTISDTESDTGTGSPSEEGASQRFPDVPPDHYAFEAVEWAAEVGVTTGYDDGTFKSERPLIKRHAVVFMERYYDEILQADESEDFTRADMMVLLKAINDGTARVTTATTTPTPAASGPFQAVAAASTASNGLHACAVRSNGDVACWGYNPLTDSDWNGEAPASGSFQAVSIGGGNVACGLRTDGTIACWGGFNLPGFEDRRLTDVPSGSFQAVSVGRSRSCAVRTDGTFVCWGSGRTWSTPEGSFQAVSAGDAHTCGLRTDGTITCWGPGETWTSTPEEASSFQSTFSSDGITCGYRFDGSELSELCWESSGSRTDAPSGSFQAVSAGDAHTCGLRTDGTITCWGRDDYNEGAAPSGSFQAVSFGDGHSCGLRADGTIACWGHNDNGQTDAPSGSFRAVSAGTGHSCGLRADGTIACWGHHLCSTSLSDGTTTCWGRDDYNEGAAP